MVEIMLLSQQNNCFIYNNEEVWCDYTDDHKDIREKSEKEINNFKNGYKVNPIILQAPYGSGKTTLMRYLLLYSWSIGIPAFKINLSELVEHLKKKQNRYESKIPADKLPEYVNELCQLIKNKALTDEKEAKHYFDFFFIPDYRSFISKEEKCVLLIDEVEESLDELNSLINFQTNPFRALFSDVDKSKILPILGYGPLTMAKSIEGTTGEWRTISLSIPLVDISYISDQIIKNKNLPDSKYNKSISNFLWFLSRGRPGWIAKSLKEGLDKKLYELLNKSDYNEIIEFLTRELVERYFPSNQFTNDTEIVNIADIENDIEENPSYSIFILNIKPTYTNNSNIAFIKNDVLFNSTQLINITNLADYYKNILKVSLKGLDSNDIIRIQKTLEKFLMALADENNNILFSKDFLSELNNALLAFIQDVFYQNPEIENVLEKIDIESMYNLLKVYAIEEKTNIASNIYTQISPNKIIQYFPLESAIPLIGEARRNRNKIYNIVLPIFDNAPVENTILYTAATLSNYSQKFKDILKAYLTENELDDKFFILLPSYLLYSNEFLRKLDDFLSEPEFLEKYTIDSHNNTLYKKFVFILINLSKNGLEKNENISSYLDQLISVKALSRLNKVYILPVYGRSAIFLAGLFYNIIRGSLDENKMTVLEKRILESFSKALSMNIYNLFKLNDESSVHTLFTQLSQDLKAIKNNIEDSYPDLKKVLLYIFRFQSKNSLDFLNRILRIYISYIMNLNNFGIYYYITFSNLSDNKKSNKYKKENNFDSDNDINNFLNVIKNVQNYDFMECLPLYILGTPQSSENGNSEKCNELLQNKNQIMSINDVLDKNYSYVDIRNYIVFYLRKTKMFKLDNGQLEHSNDIHELIREAISKIDFILGPYIKNDGTLKTIIYYNIIKEALNQDTNPRLIGSIRDLFDQIYSNIVKSYNDLNNNINKLRTLLNKICGYKLNQINELDKIEKPFYEKATLYDYLLAYMIQYDMKEKDYQIIKQPVEALISDIDNLNEKLEIIYDKINKIEEQSSLIKFDIIKDFLKFIKNENKCINVIRFDTKKLEDVLDDISDILNVQDISQDNTTKEYIQKLEILLGKGD